MWQWTHGTVESVQNRLGGAPASGRLGAAAAQVEADMLDSLCLPSRSLHRPPPLPAARSPELPLLSRC